MSRGNGNSDPGLWAFCAARRSGLAKKTGYRPRGGGRGGRFCFTKVADQIDPPVHEKIKTHSSAKIAGSPALLPASKGGPTRFRICARFAFHELGFGWDRADRAAGFCTVSGGDCTLKRRHHGRIVGTGEGPG